MKDDLDTHVLVLTLQAKVMLDCLRMEVIDENYPQIDAVLRSFLQSGSELMTSCALLARGSHDLAINILLRSIIEMVIKVRWSTLASENAILIQHTTKEQLKTMFKINSTKGLLKVLDKSGIDQTSFFLANGGADRGPKTPSIEIMATQCGLSDIYNIFYRFQSLHTHSNHIQSNSSQTVASTLGCMGIFSRLLGHLGVRWLLHRSRPSDEEIRALLGLEAKLQP